MTDSQSSLDFLFVWYTWFIAKGAIAAAKAAIGWKIGKKRKKPRPQGQQQQQQDLQQKQDTEPTKDNKEVEAEEEETEEGNATGLV